MDFTKFFALLEQRKIYFTRINNLHDPWEGYPTQPFVDDYAAGISGLDGTDRENAISKLVATLDRATDARKLICVTCWHNNPVESAGMWDLYSKKAEGIAIRTTFDRFKKAFSNSNEDINGGLVKYIDYKTYRPERFNLVLWALLKRKGFEHEREFRGILMDPNFHMHGILLDVDLDLLIDQIFVSPMMPDWTVSLLQNMLDGHGIKREIQRSTYDLNPSYDLPE